MGIGFTYEGESYDFMNSPGWSYSGFNRARERLCQKALGEQLGAFIGFGGKMPWAAYKDDIIPLLNHSDCDGELTSAECRQVAPRLRELVADWPDDDYDKRNFLKLATFMDNCAESDVALEFC